MQCPLCKGKRVVWGHMNTGPDSSKHRWGDMPCPTCNGSGEITQEHADRIEAGRKLRQQRLDAGETLREAATRQGMTTVQLSAIEQGRISAHTVERKQQMKSEFTTVPILENFMSNRVIGELKIRTDALPARSGFVFSLGYTALEETGTTPGEIPRTSYRGPYELMCVTPVTHEEYIEYLRQVGELPEASAEPSKTTR